MTLDEIYEWIDAELCALASGWFSVCAMEDPLFQAGVYLWED